MGVSSTRNAISRSKSRCGPCVAHAGMRKVGSLCCAVRVRLPYSGPPPSDGRLVYAKHHFSIQIVLWPLRGARRDAESGLVVLRGARSAKPHWGAAQDVPRMRPGCARGPRMLPACAQGAPKMRPGCPRVRPGCAPRMCPGCPRVPRMRPACAQGAPRVRPVCPRVPRMRPSCAHGGPGCPGCVHHPCAGCAQGA